MRENGPIIAVDRCVHVCVRVCLCVEKLLKWLQEDSSLTQHQHTEIIILDQWKTCTAQQVDQHDDMQCYAMMHLVVKLLSEYEALTSIDGQRLIAYINHSSDSDDQCLLWEYRVIVLVRDLYPIHSTDV